MTPNALPPVDLLRKLLRYDPETGYLYWRKRPEHMFPDNGKGGREANARRWNSRLAGKRALHNTDTSGYLRGRLLETKHRAHRVIWAMVYGTEPSGLIDHANGDKADNRLDNLRVVDASGNMSNRKLNSNSTTGVPGVAYRPKYSTWTATISHQGKRRFIGTFGSLDDAVAARKAAEQRYGFHPNHGRSQ